MPSAKENLVLTGTDFLSKVGIVLDVVNQHGYFIRNPKKKFHFAEDNFLPLNETAKKPAMMFSILVKMKANTCLKIKEFILVTNIKSIPISSDQKKLYKRLNHLLYPYHLLGEDASLQEKINHTMIDSFRKHNNFSERDDHAIKSSRRILYCDENHRDHYIKKFQN